MLVLVIVFVVSLALCLGVWILLRPKTCRIKKGNPPSVKRTHDLSNKSDARVEAIGKSLITSADRRKT